MPAQFTPRRRTDDVARADELLARLDDGGLTLVDARAPERWRGETEPIDPVAGRIPGALNRYFEDDSPLPLELLEADDIVVYCGSGVTACAVLHELHLAGRDDARLYPGSFSEWYALGPVERAPDDLTKIPKASPPSPRARASRRAGAPVRRDPDPLRAHELVLAVLELDEREQRDVAQPQPHRQALRGEVRAQLVRERAAERFAPPPFLVVPELAERGDVRGLTSIQLP